jgi:guanine deaminase
MEQIFALKGNVIFTKDTGGFTAVPNGYIVVRDGLVEDVFFALPEKYRGIRVEDFGDKIIVPGLTDLHIHAPQFAARAMGMDLELLPWLKKYAFPEEARYIDLEYAKAAYGRFCRALKNGATTRAVVFGTVHIPATVLLMDLLEKTGLYTCVGKVNMDRNCPDNLCETAEQSVSDTVQWLESALPAYKRTKPAVTPRFVPACSGELLEALGKTARQYDLPVQSHLSENRDEVRWVKELHPDCAHYSGIYAKYGLFGNGIPTVMAHCVYPEEEELALIEKNGVFIAHCPQSNMNLASGIAPMRRMLDRGIKIGLGSDVAGGCSASIFRAMSDAIQASKLYSALVDKEQKPLTLAESFYMGTKGGGSFFGKVGSFEPGYAFDAVVVDDARTEPMEGLTLEQRLERIVYLSTDGDIAAKYAGGERIDRPAG